MFYKFSLDRLPTIHLFYSVTRNTIWQITDRFHILIFIDEGNCEIFCDGENYTLHKGDFFFIPAGHSYTRRPVNNTLCTMTYTHFTVNDPVGQVDTHTLVSSIAAIKANIDAEILSGEAISYPDTIYLPNHLAGLDYESISSQLHNISLFSSNRQLMCSLQSKIILCSILAQLSQKTIDTIQTDTSFRNEKKIPPNLKKAISYIVRHSYEQITLDSLSAHCNVSKQQMIRYFKTAFGITPNTYITEYKIARAKELLFNYSSLTIKEIASELGFGTQYYFTTVFTKVTGETPSAYRYRTINYNPDAQKEE